VPTVFWWRYLGERNHLGNLSIDGRIISKYIFKLDGGGGGGGGGGLYFSGTEERLEVGCGTFTRELYFITVHVV